MKAAEKAALYRELAKLTAADFHLDRSVALLISQKPLPWRRQYLDGLQRGLAAGKSVAASVAEENAALVTGLETSLIDAGERSGTLSESFSHLALYFAAMDDAARKAKGAVIYPLVLVHLAIMLPELPGLIVPEVSTGNPFGKMALTLGILWSFLLGGAWLWRRLSREAETSPAMDGRLRKLPLIGAVRRHWALARFAQVFHSGLLAALRISEILYLAGNASQSGQIRAASDTAAKFVETTGQPLSEALARTNSFPDDFVHSVATAEEVGSLDAEMGRWAAVETELATEAISRTAVWLPKIGYGIVVLFVCFRIYTMVEGYYGGMLRQIEKF